MRSFNSCLLTASANTVKDQSAHQDKAVSRGFLNDNWVKSLGFIIAQQPLPTARQPMPNTRQLLYSSNYQATSTKQELYTSTRQQLSGNKDQARLITPTGQLRSGNNDTHQLGNESGNIEVATPFFGTLVNVKSP